MDPAVNLSTPPELFDGGYWYVIVATVTANEIGLTGFNATPGWCAWYGDVGGTLYAAVRSPVPVDDALAQGPSATAVLLAAGYSADKPFGRVGGL